MICLTLGKLMTFTQIYASLRRCCCCVSAALPLAQELILITARDLRMFKDKAAPQRRFKGSLESFCALNLYLKWPLSCLFLFFVNVLIIDSGGDGFAGSGATFSLS